MGIVCKANGMARTIVFLFRRRRKKVVVLLCIFGHDFLSLRILHAIVSGIKNYPSACIACCSNDLSLSLPCLDLWSLGSENVSFRGQIFASSRPKWHIWIFKTSSNKIPSLTVTSCQSSGCFHCMHAHTSSDSHPELSNYEGLRLG